MKKEHQQLKALSAFLSETVQMGFLVPGMRYMINIFIGGNFMMVYQFSLQAWKPKLVIKLNMSSFFCPLFCATACLLLTISPLQILSSVAKWVGSSWPCSHINPKLNYQLWMLSVRWALPSPSSWEHMQIVLIRHERCWQQTLMFGMGWVGILQAQSRMLRLKVSSSTEMH